MGKGMSGAVADWIYLAALLWPLLCLTYLHARGRIDLLTTITTTKDGQTFVDQKKLAYVGAFAASTIAFAYLAVTDRFSEWFVYAYLTAFVAGKWLGDREQRLNKELDVKHPAPPGTVKATP